VFTGIVEEQGVVDRLERQGESLLLTVRARRVMEDLAVSQSVSVSGACLTVVGRTEDTFTVVLAPETLRRTTLGALQVGDAVNLERAVRVGDRMGGHYVQGHVDGVGKIVAVEPEGDSLMMTIEPPRALLLFIVEKGFVAVDGVSLTVAGRDATTFKVALVAYTRSVVTLGQKRPGDRVNIEVDIVAKYVATLVTGYLERFEERACNGGQLDVS